MESWMQVIIEWVNCLDISESPIQSLQELQDGKTFVELIKILSQRKNRGHMSGQEEIIQFIQDEYPQFITENGGGEGNLEEVHIASLLLLHASQEPKLHRPMCIKLPHETQIKIKTFLEQVMPNGKSLTRDHIDSAILAMAENLPKTPPRTPKTHLLKDFFNSPAAYSAKTHNVIDERNRELRHLRSELELERFEKADLQEDIRIQQEKIKDLQKKLKDKTEEVKKIRAEWMRPPSPRSCKKMKESARLQEERYCRERQNLETYCATLQTQIETLQDEGVELRNKLSSTERKCSAFKERCEHSERTLEFLTVETTAKDQELEQLRTHVEELRSHIHEMRKESIGEQSFEMESVLMAQSPLRSFNTSEALSSVIDIQLQEAKDESNVLRAEVETLTQRLGTLDQEHQELQRVNLDLQAKASLLEAMQQELSATQNAVSSLEQEKSLLLANLSSLRDTLAAREELLEKTKKHGDDLKQELDAVRHKLSTVENTLNLQNVRVEELELAATRDKSTITENLGNINKLMMEAETLTQRLRTLDQEYQELQRVNLDLQAKASLLEATQQELSATQNAVSSLEQEKSLLLANLSSLRDTLAAREELLEKTKKHGDDLKQELDAVRHKLSTVENTLNLQNVRVEELELAADRDKSTINENLGNINKLMMEAETLTQRLGTLDQEYQELQRVNLDLQAKASLLEATQQELSATQHAISSLEQEKSLLLENSSSLRDSLAAKEELLEKTKKHGDDLKQELDAVRYKLSTVQNTLNLQNVRVEELELATTRDKSTITENLGNIDKLMMEAETLTQRLRTLDQEYQELQRVNLDLQAKASLLEATQQELSATQHAVSDLEQEKSLLLANSSSLRDTLAAKEELLEKTKKHGDDLKQELDAVRHKLSTVQNTLNLQNVRVEELELAADRDKSTITENLDNINKLMIEAETLTQRLGTLDQEYQELQRVNLDLQAKANLLEATQQELSATQNALTAHSEKMSSLEQEKSLLLANLSSLRDTLAAKEELLEKTKKHGDDLKQELDAVRHKLSTVQNTLNLQNVRVEELELAATRDKSTITENLGNINKLMMEAEDYKSIIGKCSSILGLVAEQASRLTGHLEVDSGSSTIVDRSEHLKTLMDSLEIIHSSKESDISALNATVEERDQTILKLRLDVSNLEEINRRAILEHTRLSKNMEEASLKISELETVISHNTREIEELRTIAIQRDVLLAELETVKADLAKRTVTLDSVEILLKETEEHRTALSIELESTRQKLTQKLAEQREQTEEMVRKMSKEHEELQSTIVGLESEKEQLKSFISMRNNDLAIMENARTSLENEIQNLKASQLSRQQEHQDQLAKAKNTLDNLTKEKLQLVSTVNSMKNGLQELKHFQREMREGQVILAENNRVSLALLSDNLNEHIKMLAKKNSELMENEEMLKKQMNILRTRMAEESEEHIKEQTQKDEYINVLKAVKEELSSNLEDTRARIEKYAEVESKQQDLLASLHADVENLKDEKHGFENLVREQKKIITEARVEQEELTKNLLHAKVKSSDLETKLGAMSSDLKQLEEQNACLEKNILEAEREKLKLTENIAVLQNDLAQSKLELQKLDLIQINLQNEHDAATANNTKIIETLKNKLDKQSKNIELLQQQLADVTEHLRLESQRAEALNAETVKLAETKQNVEAKMNDAVECLENKLSEAQKSLDHVNLELTKKTEMLTLLEGKVKQLNDEKAESELKQKEIITNMQEVRASQEALLETQTKALNEKNSYLDDLQKQYSQLKNIMNEEVSKERNAREEFERKCMTLEKENHQQTETVKELQVLLEHERRELKTQREHNAAMESENLKVLQICEILKNSTSNLKCIVEESRPSLQNLYGNLAATNSEIPSDTQICLETSQSQSSDATEKTIINVLRFLNRVINLTQEGISFLSSTRKDLETAIVEERKLSLGVSELKERNAKLEILRQHWEQDRSKYRNLCSTLINAKHALHDLLVKALASRSHLDHELTALKRNFTEASLKFQSHFDTDTSACDELKHLQGKKKSLKNAIEDLSARHSQSLQPLIEVLCQVFLWTEKKLEEISLSPTDQIDPNADSLSVVAEVEFPNECSIMKAIIKKYEAMQDEITASSKDVQEFVSLATSYETAVNSGQIKRELSVEEKLQRQIEQLSKEKKEVKDKLAMIRVRNAKLEKNLDELRKEVKKVEAEKLTLDSTAQLEELKRTVAILEEEKKQLQIETDSLRGAVKKLEVEKSTLDSTVELEQLRTTVAKLEEEKKLLEVEKEQLRRRPTEGDFENRLKTVHDEYGLKLEKIKQKMKIAYNEQREKLNQEQEKAVREKVEGLRVKMEQQCRKHTEEITKYKEHVSELSSQFWDVGEKLLAEKQEKEIALQRLEDLKRRLNLVKAPFTEINEQNVPVPRNKTASLDRRNFAVDRQSARSVEVIEEEVTTYARRRSVKSMQTMGNAFKVEDEEGEVFDNTYLADMKEGFCLPSSQPDLNRLSVLQMRNSLCKPHLKSSYPAETQFQPLVFSEEEIKSGGTVEDVFNDSLSQSLLPGQKSKKRDRTQTSYKRPGPPTPSKNGGRLSLQGNELRSPNSRILREQNSERRATATPRRLRDLFSSSLTKKSDENVPGTPRSRRLSSIFRKPR